MTPIAGYVGIACGGVGRYVAFAHFVNAVFSRDLVPTWPLTQPQGDQVSLSAHDRQALARIEETLADADSQFAARMSAFSRLADDKAVPERERICGSIRRAIGSGCWSLRSSQSGARKVSCWIAVAIAVAITLAVISAALVSGHADTKDTCAERHDVACAGQATPSAPHALSGQKGSVPFLAP